MSLEIAELYGHVSLQGPRTFGLRHFGVPPGGPFDRESHGVANALLGNHWDAVCVELAMAAGRLIALRPIEVGMAGAVCAVTVDGSLVQTPRKLDLDAGQEVRIAAPTQGARLYLSLPGGVGSENVRRGGGLVALEPNRQRLLSNGQDMGRPLQSIQSGRAIRAIAFGDSELLAHLVGCQGLKVRLDSDRVGIRLDGLNLDPGPEKLSEPACPGAIQVTNDGSLIVLGPDGPTIGGYRKIGIVCAADMDALGQLRLGESVRFEEVSRKAAVSLWTARNG